MKKLSGFKDCALRLLAKQLLQLASSEGDQKCLIVTTVVARLVDDALKVRKATRSWC